MKKELNIAIGARVRAARQKMGFSREALSEILDISTLFLGYIECGQKGMSLETLCAMCRALHVSADYLLLGEQQAAKPEIDPVAGLLGSVDAKYYPLLQDHLQLFLKTITIVQADTLQQKNRLPSDSTAQPAELLSYAARNGEDAVIRIDDPTARALSEELSHLPSEEPSPSL